MTEAPMSETSHGLEDVVLWLVLMLVVVVLI